MSTQRQKLLCFGRVCLSPCVSKLPPHSCEHLGGKEDGRHTCVDTIWSGHVLPGEAEPAELRLEQSPGCCNQTQILHNWLPGNPGPSRPWLQQRFWPQMPCNSQSISASEKFQVVFPPLTLSRRRNCCPGQKEVYLLDKRCYFFQVTLQRKPIVCCHQLDSRRLYCDRVSHEKTTQQNLKVVNTTLFSWCCNTWDRASSRELQEKELRN